MVERTTVTEWFFRLGAVAALIGGACSCGVWLENPSPDANVELLGLIIAVVCGLSLAALFIVGGRTTRNHPEHQLTLALLAVFLAIVTGIVNAASIAGVCLSHHCADLLAAGGIYASIACPLIAVLALLSGLISFVMRGRHSSVRK
ncbi:MAG TPA: hypothetical protein VKX16_08395 [Chloroflexota bacterium]|nr:hypothetical protein [Chloroflexota bacterium]